jgi:hypothetical protein
MSIQRVLFEVGTAAQKAEYLLFYGFIPGYPVPSAHALCVLS